MQPVVQTFDEPIVLARIVFQARKSCIFEPEAWTLEVRLGHDAQSDVQDHIQQTPVRDNQVAAR